MAIRKKTFTVADTAVDAGWKKESASTHRKYPATKSQMTLFDRALFMMTSQLQGDGARAASFDHDQCDGHEQLVKISADVARGMKAGSGRAPART